MKPSNHSKEKKLNTIIVGAGSAGLGIGIILKQMGIDFTILERDSIGASFKKWPQETRFISPSFTGNFFKMPDLNAISPDSSPAFSLLTEHPSGKEYAQYLEDLAQHYELPIQTKIEVLNIKKKNRSFLLETNHGTYESTFVIWAAGEYQYPKRSSFPGSELCLHYADVKSFSKLEGKDHIVIGAYESGFDAAIHLAKSRKKVTLLDGANYLELVNSDSSYSLSPYTRDRIDQHLHLIDYYEKTRIEKVEYIHEEYLVTTDTQEVFSSPFKPINCTGFESSLSLVSDLFEFKEEFPLLSKHDESTKTSNLFLVGPQVKHGNALFCFIYKYRQRFAIVAEQIAKKNKIPRQTIHEIIQPYQKNNFYLRDLSCCNDTCTC